MKNVHIMLDLETWGTQPGCDIRSIGAVVFDPFRMAIGNSELPNPTFYIATRYTDALDHDPNTVEWWSKQSSDTLKAFDDPKTLWTACFQFAHWLWKMSHPKEHKIRFENYEPLEHVLIWSNGPHFDIAILQSVYRHVGLSIPWHYRAPRDFRTIVDAANISRDEYCNHGEAHNALDDAIAQALTVCKAYRKLNIHDKG